MTIASALLKVPAVLILAAAPLSPVAVVEDVVGGAGGVQMMDYVTPGEVIKLGPKDTIVLGYLTSCSREKITGGTVTVGPEHSAVVGGSVQRTTTPCGGGKIALNSATADKSAAMAFREIPQGGFQKPVQPQVTVYGRSPVVELKPIGALVIERVDVPGERHDIILGDAHLMRGKFLDLAMADVELSPGGIYKARVGAQEIVFKFDHQAKAGETPIAGRLLRLQPH
jgi:hypothetical protein